MNNNEDILSLIARNLEGVANSDEIFKINIWLQKSDENKKYFDECRNIWEASGSRMSYENINNDVAMDKVLGRINKASQRRTVWFYWQKVAAIFIIPVILGSFLIISNNKIKYRSHAKEIIYNEVHAAFGTRSQLFLSDSTVVWLNSGSSLKYPVTFEGNLRKVYLSGEAYFDVESDESRPFIVETATLQVKATGTKFNVQEYNNNPISEVMLVSGKLTVNESDPVRNYQLISALNPNQYLSFNKLTKEKFIMNDDASKYIQWKDGKLVFRNEPLERVLSKISLMFNVDIELQGEQLRNYRYHATFVDESLEEILKLLKLSAPINFREIKRTPLPDGSFPKKKVIVFQAS